MYHRIWIELEKRQERWKKNSSIYWFIHQWNGQNRYKLNFTIISSGISISLSPALCFRAFRSSTSHFLLTWLLRHLSTFNLKCVFSRKKYKIKSYWDIMRSRFFLLHLSLLLLGVFFFGRCYYYFVHTRRNMGSLECRQQFV